MSKKRKAAHELKWQRPSTVLAKRLKRYPAKTYDMMQDVFDTNDKLKIAIQKRFLDGDEGIPELSKKLYLLSDEILEKLHNIIKYCSVIDKRIIDNLDKVNEEFQESLDLINKNITTDASINTEELNNIHKDLKDLTNQLVNIMHNQKKMARDLRREKQHIREKTWKSLEGVFRSIRKRARRVRGEVKDEKIDEKKIKHYSSVIKKQVKDILNHKNDEKESEKDNKKLIKEFNKTIENYIKIIKDEIETIKTQVKLLFEIEKYTTVAYFEVLNVIKLNFDDKITYLKDNNYVYQTDLENDNNDLKETIEENKEFDLYIEKWLSTKINRELK